VSGDDGRLVLGKSPTTRKRIFEGLSAGLDLAAEQIGLPVHTVLERCGLFVYEHRPKPDGREHVCSGGR
jgi:hypothetical protein